MSATSSVPPVALPINPDGIPAALKDKPQWVSWRFEWRDGKWTKIPINPATGRKASPTDSATWTTFADALAYSKQEALPGIGFVVTRDDCYIGIDLDKCRNPASGEIAPWAADIIDRFGSYTEISPSGTGVRIWITEEFAGLLPDGSAGRRNGLVEVYAADRYFTVTGHRLTEKTTIEPRWEELDTLFKEIFHHASERPVASLHGTSAPLSDDEVLALARKAANRAKFVRLWAGDTTGHNGDDSAADLALLGILAFYTQDVDQLDRLFRRSGLYREKWNRSDYRNRTIQRALERSEVYQPNGRNVPSDLDGMPTGVNEFDRARDPSGSFGSGFGDRASDENPWPLMADLSAPTSSGPTMSVDMVPEPFRARAVDIADLTKLPLEMVAVPMIAAAGAVIGRAVGLRPWQYDDFTVVPNLWGAVIARPGWLKSSAIKEAFHPLGRLAGASRASHEAREEEDAVKRERIEAEMAAIKTKMKENAKKGAALSDLETELATKRAELRAATATERRFLTHDTSVEKLGELLRDNPRGMLVLRDELSGWLRTMEKPGHEGDREFYLEGWNGTGSYTVDRIGRGTIHIPSMTISVFGGIQPGKLQSLIASAVDGGFGDDGLLQRFQLTVWPDRLPPWVKPDRWPDKDARDNVAAIFESLAVMVGETVGAAHDDIPYLRFAPFAQATADTWRDALEARLRSDEFDATPAFASHLAKYRSLMPALALLFYLIDRAAEAPGTSRGAVAEHHVRLAIQWCEYLEAHARKLYAVELQGGLSAAHALAAKMQAGAVYDSQPVRELYRPQWAGLRTPERVQAGLAELADLGWVRLESRTTDGRPSQVVRLHPHLVNPPNPRSPAPDGTDEREKTDST